MTRKSRGKWNTQQMRSISSGKWDFPEMKKLISIFCNVVFFIVRMKEYKTELKSEKKN